MNNSANHRHFAQKMANVFLGEKGIKVSQGSMNIAYVNTKTKEISFDFDKIFKSNDVNDLFDEMMTFKGLLFHEIHHLKFPNNCGKYIQQDLFRLLQVLDDGRIETLGVLKYNKLADFFIYSINNILIKNRNKILTPDKHTINMYIVMYGRKLFWQDMELLKQMRELVIMMYGKDVIKQIEDYIDQYIYETSTNKRIDIARKILELFDKNKIQDNSNDFKGTNSQLNTGIQDPKQMPKEMKELLDILKKAIQRNKQITNQLRQDTKDAVDKSAERKEKISADKEKLQEIQAEITKADIKRGKAKTDKTWTKYDNIFNKKSQEKYDLKNSMIGKGYSPDGVETMTELIIDMIRNKEQEQIILINKHEYDLTQDLKEIGHSLDGVFSDNSFSPTTDMQSKANQLEKSLKKMNTELVKGYVRNQNTGRFNARSLFNRKSITDVKIFNKYIPDRIKSTKILVNIFIDGSGSMRGRYWVDAINSLWVINEALNRDQNKIMVYQFASNYQRFKDYNRPLTIPSMFGGGTNPTGAIREAIPIIEKYKKVNGYSNVVDIIITDGAFDTNCSSDEEISKLNKLGHETILIKVGYSSYNDAERDRHKAKHYIRLNNFDELVPSLAKIFTTIKKSLIKKVV